MSRTACIIGGGAAGLFCAATAARRGVRVLVLDHAPSAGRRLLVTGGGKCNFTNRQVTEAHYQGANPRFCRGPLARFGAEAFVALVEAQDIAYEERQHGQLFCRHGAEDILRLLLADCRQAGVEMRWGVHIERVEQGPDQNFVMQVDREPLRCDRLVLATGGRSRPALGASDLGLRLAAQFGHRIVEPAPALVPLRLSADQDPDLPGIAVTAAVATGTVRFCDQLLFTHGGLSGPVILQISTWWRPGQTLTIDLLPNCELEERLRDRQSGRQSLATLLSRLLPRRLIQARVEARVLDTAVAQLSRTDISAVARALKAWQVQPSGTAGWGRAEVMRGGVDTDQFSSRTMESRLVPGLFAIGEVLDITGHLGGYNLQWAWTSGHVAGEAL